MENLNGIESVTDSAEVMEWQATETIAKSPASDVDKWVKASSIVDKGQLENIRREAAEARIKWLENNIGIKIPNINIENRWNPREAAINLLKWGTENIKNPANRMRLCRQILTCMELEENIVPKKVQNALLSWKLIIPWEWVKWFNGNDYCCNRQEFKLYNENARNFAKSKIKWVYEKLFYPDSFNSNIDIKSLSTWDWSGTTWTAWEMNVWRLFRSYRNSADINDKLDTTKNSITFWRDETQPTKITMYPSGYDGKWWQADIILKSKNNDNKICTITFEYNSKDGMISKYVWELPDWVKINKDWVSLPHDMKDKYSVSLKTSSYKYDNEDNQYDEINFDVVVENWWLWWSERIKNSFEWWKYIINDADKQDISQKMDEIMEEINKWKKMKIELDMASDTTAFGNKDDTEMKKNSGNLIKKIEQEMSPDTDLLSSIINQFKTSFDNNTKNVSWKHKDWSTEKNAKQTALQKELALNRFLGIFYEMIQNKSFKEKLKKWEIPFEVSFTVKENDRYVTIKAKPIS